MKGDRVVLVFGWVLLVTTAVSGQERAPALDAAVVRQAVESVAAVVEREYVDPQVAARVARSLEQKLRDGNFAGARTLAALAESLTRDLFAATADKHLAVRVTGSGTPPEGSAASAEMRAVRARRSNFGVQRVEILAGNVGYLNLTSFYRPEEARAAVAAAMRLLSGADALILDMRQNSGGSPDTVALVAGYLFEAPGLPLFEIVPRSGTRSLYTTPDPAVADRNRTRPVFVLTAKGTFSAGEGLAFILQERGRAEVIGERTAGAANAGRPYTAAAGFEVTVPNGQVRGVISGRTWEGTGVAPDVAVPASDALRFAHIRALGHLIDQEESSSRRERLEQDLERLQQGAEAGSPLECVSFETPARILAGQGFSASIGRGLEFRLTPDGGTGWGLSVGPSGSRDDFLWLVSPPFGTAPHRQIGAGYNLTAEQSGRLSPRSFRFVASRVEYAEIAELVDRAQRDVEGALTAAEIERKGSGSLQLWITGFGVADGRDEMSWVALRGRACTPR